MEKITLIKPIKHQDGTEIRELQLDFDSLTTGDLRQVHKLEQIITDPSSVSIMDAVNDRYLRLEFQIASGFIAAIKGTEGLCVSDFTQLSMKDAINISKLSSFFWNHSDLDEEETSQSSTDPLEKSPSDSTPTLQAS